MAVTLTPEQQAALEEFDKAADHANDALQATKDADAALAAAELQATHDQKEAIDSQTVALEKATVFVRLMVPGAPAPAGAPKKG